MTRRHFLKTLTSGIIYLGCVPEVMAQMNKIRIYPYAHNYDIHIKDYLIKITNFDAPHKNDVIIEEDNYSTFQSVLKRIKRLQSYVGHGNFYLLSFDRGIRMAKNSSNIGAFTRDELDFMEKIFYTDATIYGFFGQKTLGKMTGSIREKDVIRVPYSGNYLFKGDSHKTYLKIKKEIGQNVILTSGIRGVMKQFLLFLNKVQKNNGNISLASRSLAPPGYSYHGNGDFDVGQLKFGINNFTARFAKTEVFRMLSELGYLKLRYPQNNLLGVRYEPWHISINMDV